jgi:hypothetical protein
VTADQGSDSGEESNGALAGVRKWLKESGYPLEMRVAAQVRSACSQVDQSRYYVDAETQKLREVDVLAQTYARSLNPYVHLVFVFECKAAQTSWVAFLGDHRFYRDDHELVESFDCESNQDSLTPRALTSVYSCPVLHSTEPTAYALQQQGKQNEGAFTAVTQVLSAMDGVRGDLTTGSADKPLLRVMVPVLVTSGPLVTCALDANGEIDLHHAERVLLVSRLRPEPKLRSVWVVQEEGLAAFIQDMATTRERLGVDWKLDGQPTGD